MSLGVPGDLLTESAAKAHTAELVNKTEKQPLLPKNKWCRRVQIFTCWGQSLHKYSRKTIPAPSWPGVGLRPGAIFGDQLLLQPSGQGTLNCGAGLLAGSPASSSGQLA